MRSHHLPAVAAFSLRLIILRSGANRAPISLFFAVVAPLVVPSPWRRQPGGGLSSHRAMGFPEFLVQGGKLPARRAPCAMQPSSFLVTAGAPVSRRPVVPEATDPYVTDAVHRQFYERGDELTSLPSAHRVAATGSLDTQDPRPKRPKANGQVGARYRHDNP